MVNESNNKPTNLLERLFVALQYILPHHFLSGLMYHLTRSEWAPLKNGLIRNIIRLYRINMNEAIQPEPTSYLSFNDFFTRALKPAARPIDEHPSHIVCPADGAVSQIGTIEKNLLIQAKGRYFNLTDLLGGKPEDAEPFIDGLFTTIYLSPRDYHRVHMPCSGTLESMAHVPGRLFSVNETTSRLVPGLYARNERVICRFETELGPMAMILVGAIFVSSIDTVWAGTVTPASQRVSRVDYRNDVNPQPVNLDKGAEMGRFNMGSTVILLFGRDSLHWKETLTAGTRVHMGEWIARKIN